jgi:ATP-dependent protease ClpP protease subunit
MYINSAGGNVTDGLALHDSIRQLVDRGIEVTIIVQGHGLLDGIGGAAGGQRRPRLVAAALVDHDSRAGEVGGLAVDVSGGAAPGSAQADAVADLRAARARSGRPLKQIIKDTKRTDFYLDAKKALDYGLIDAVIGEI